MYYVYIISNKNHSVLYTGMTNDLIRRLYEHKYGITKGFSTRYHLQELLYYEATENVSSAIEREKEIKG